MSRATDPKSVAGKSPRVDRHVPLVVVGAGVAGVAAATVAARAGVEVLLVDENPIDFDLMAMDVPLYFGQRMAPTARNRTAMLERLVRASEGLAEADDAGVDVALATCVWGAFRNGPSVRELAGPMLGLADLERSWLVGYDRLVVATGARDVALGFPGWEQAGTMGASAAFSLMTRYGALASRQMVVLGSGPLGLETAARALRQGVAVAGVVDVADPVRGDPALRQALERQGVRFFTAHTVREGRGRTGELESVVLVRVDADLAPIAGSETELACDTVCLALGLVPSVELLNLLGCHLAFRSGLGGFVPEVDGWMQTSTPGVFAAGDCAGFHEGVLADPGHARTQGRLAGIAAAASLGAIDEARARALRDELPVGPAAEPVGVHGYWRRWLRSQLKTGGWHVNVCQCEEVTRRELSGVQPPRYLEWRSAPMSGRSVATLLEDGPLNQDQVKRLTRVGMGPCQGRRCREQVGLLLSEVAGLDFGAVPMPSYRTPVRPLPLSVLWPADEPQAVRDHWVSWFGIMAQTDRQWKPS